MQAYWPRRCALLLTLTHKRILDWFGRMSHSRYTLKAMNAAQPRVPLLRFGAAGAAAVAVGRGGALLLPPPQRVVQRRHYARAQLVILIAPRRVHAPAVGGHRDGDRLEADGAGVAVDANAQRRKLPENG